MSVVVGLETQGGVWLAWDSASTYDDGEQELVGTKGFKLSGIGVGVVGGRHDLVLRHYLDVDQPGKTVNVEHWGATTLANAVYTQLSAANLHTEDWGALFAVRGVLLRMDKDWSCMRSLRGYTAIGSGAEYALGSMHSTAELVGADAQRRVELAVEAAAAHSAGVRLPVSTMWCSHG